MRRLAAAAIRWSGLAWLVRNTVARRRVSIILYHDPDPGDLDRQLAFLARRYSLIGLDLLVDALRSGDWSAVPPRSLVLTIDDGHAGNARLREVLLRHRVRPTLFVCTQIVATTRRFWFEQAGEQAAEELKVLPDGERLERLEREHGFTESRAYGPERRQALDRAEIEALAEVCDLQAHSRFHPILTRCGEDRVREEIEGSRAEVIEIAGSSGRHFAFPAGAYSGRELGLVRAAGYDSARTVDIGWNGPRTDPHRLRILSVADGFSNTMLAADLSGLKWLSRLVRREGGRDGRFRPRWARGPG